MFVLVAAHFKGKIFNRNEKHLRFQLKTPNFNILIGIMIEERIGRKLLCECELLHDERTMRRKELELVFGLDFGGPR